ncbi:hypothetical protein BKE38_15015 [Pseudoroseomonas deserti]|uniref:Uncharacterized protein n=1 Tax=Teichococcus deserti TaxID=1817963 RepID=A0A1V2H141_9PROT|nr:hypothetical protein [Pseudoroseomonas deserti]ONG52120.1 hypothetical protein BKE38_15015 [Pseudoroseomonas deserti]
MRAIATDRLPPAGNRVLILAWVVEGLAVLTGLVLAIYAGLEGGSSGQSTLMAMLPFLALSVVELAKIPLIAVAFRVRAWGWKVIATLALLAVTLATCANFIFGFERGFNERLRAVEHAEQAVAHHQAEAEARAGLLALQRREAQQLETQLAAWRQQRTAIQKQSEDDSSALLRFDPRLSLQAELQQRQEALPGFRAAQERLIRLEQTRCRQAPETACRSAGLQRSFNAQLNERQQRIAQLGRQIGDEQAKLRQETADIRLRRDADILALDEKLNQGEAHMASLAITTSEAGQAARQAAADLAGAEQNLAAARDSSQLHRLALAIAGQANRGAIELTKQIFVVALAAIVALMGSLLAALHYAAQPRPARLHNPDVLMADPTPPSPPRRSRRRSAWEAFLRARRGYYLRRSREIPLVREVPVVQLEVIDRLKMVYLPMDATEKTITDLRADAQAAS